MKTTNILIVVSMMAVIITAGCFEGPIYNLDYGSYPIVGAEVIMELNRTEVMNINNTTFPHAVFKRLNYTYRFDAGSSTDDHSVELMRNTTEFKYSGWLDIYIYAKKENYTSYTGHKTGLIVAHGDFNKSVMVDYRTENKTVLKENHTAFLKNILKNEVFSNLNLTVDVEKIEVSVSYRGS